MGGPWHWLAPLIVLLILLLIATGLCFCKFPSTPVPKSSQDPRAMMRNIDQADVIGNPNCPDLPLDNTVMLTGSARGEARQNGDKVEKTYCEMTEMPNASGNRSEDDEIDLGLGTQKPGLVLTHVSDRHKQNLPKYGNPELDEESLMINLNYDDVNTMNDIDQDITDISEDAPMIPSNKK